MAGIDLSGVSLPYSLDAEQTVLGTIILDSSAMAAVLDRLTPEHFHVGLHNELFKVLVNMFNTSVPIDLVTIIEQSVRQNVFDNQDDARSYLLKLGESVVNPSGITDYARIIEEKFMIRSLMYSCKEIFDMANGGQEPGQVMDCAEQMIYELRSRREISGLKPIQPLVLEKIKELEAVCENPEKAAEGVISSSFSALDRYIFGLNPSDLILIAGRPGMGKTTLAVNIATNAARQHPDKEVAIFSFEMSREQLVGRMIASEALISSDKLRRGDINSKDWENIGAAADALCKMKIYIDDSANVSIGEIKAKLRRMNNLGLVVIDYLQLMSTNRRDGNRVNEIAEITRNLKLMAKDLGVPLILASQLSRAIEKRTEGTPLLSDLRESGSIEQDADIVIFLYKDADNEERPNTCKFKVAKNRHGETGGGEFHWEGQFFRFSSLESRYA